MHKCSKTFYPHDNVNYHNSLGRLWVHMRSYVCPTKEGRSLPLEQMHSASHKYSRSIHESWQLSFKSPRVVRSKTTSEQYQDPLFMVQPTVHCCYGQSSRFAGHQKWHVLLHLFLFWGGGQDILASESWSTSSWCRVDLLLIECSCTFLPIPLLCHPDPISHFSGCLISAEELSNLDFPPPDSMHCHSMVLQWREGNIFLVTHRCSLPIVS